MFKHYRSLFLAFFLPFFLGSTLFAHDKTKWGYDDRDGRQTIALMFTINDTDLRCSDIKLNTNLKDQYFEIAITNSRDNTQFIVNGFSGPRQCFTVALLQTDTPYPKDISSKAFGAPYIPMHKLDLEKIMFFVVDAHTLFLTIPLIKSN